MDPGSPRTRLKWWLGVAVLLTATGVGAWYWFGRERPTSFPALGPTAAAAEESAAAAPVSVEVAAPRPGGIERVCVQPGTVEPFESADLYAKVSGFLAEQTVDIGSRVQRGQVLARISVPEYEKAVERDQARVEDAKSKVKQMEAHLKAARAAANAALAQIALADHQVKSKTAYRVFRKKQLERIRDLSRQQAIDERRVDELEDQYEAALEAEYAAQAQVTAAREQADAADAKVLQSEADLDEAKADVGVAEAELAKSKVWLDYTVITSPYDGVITKRNFFRGDFVRAADVGGGGIPLLSVDRTDKMRVVVQVPDRDVPYVNVGDPATLEIDALPGWSVKAAVSRYADAEDSGTRLMRAEVDVPNPDDKLRRGMYGRATLLLDTGAANALRIPADALIRKSTSGTASVRVVRDGRVHVVQVRVGTDNGIEAEVLAGLTRADQVIVRAAGPVEEGTAVTAVPAAAPGH